MSEQAVHVICSGDGLGGAIVGVPSNLGVSLMDDDGNELDMRKLRIELIDPTGVVLLNQVSNNPFMPSRFMTLSDRARTLERNQSILFRFIREFTI